MQIPPSSATIFTRASSSPSSSDEMACRTFMQVTVATTEWPSSSSRRPETVNVISYTSFWPCVLTEPPFVFLSATPSTLRSLER